MIGPGGFGKAPNTGESRGTPEAIPTIAGNYTSRCLICSREMFWADKRCRDCDRSPNKPSERLP